MHALAVLLAASALGLALAPPLASEPSAGERPAGTLVFLSQGNRLTSVDVASGDQATRRMPGVASCGPELQVTGGRVVFAGYRKRGTVVYSVPVGLDERPRKLGRAHQFVRSATAGRVWLVGTSCRRAHMTGVKEVTVDGRVTQRSSRQVPSSYVAGATERGLVLWRRRAWFVWNPISGRRLGRPEPAFRRELSASVSPDGELLAKAVDVRRRWHVELIDARTGASRIVPGSATGKFYPDPRWSESSGWLFFRAGRDRLKAYRPGARRAITLHLRWPRKAVAYVGG